MHCEQGTGASSGSAYPAQNELEAWGVRSLNAGYLYNYNIKSINYQGTRYTLMTSARREILIIYWYDQAFLFAAGINSPEGATISPHVVILYNCDYKQL